MVLYRSLGIEAGRITAIADEVAPGPKMLGLADQIGTVDVGKAADLVVLREDPRVDLEAAVRRCSTRSARAWPARRTREWRAAESPAHRVSIEKDCKSAPWSWARLPCGPRLAMLQGCVSSRW
jgi:hypothetical protein